MFGGGVLLMSGRTMPGASPPSPRRPYRAWSAYDRGAVALVMPPAPDRLRGREHDDDSDGDEA